MDPKRQAILQLLSQDSAYEDHFFKTKKNPIWFYALKEKGYFDPKKNPSVQPADREGYYIIPQWNVLEYLERLAEQVNVPENEKYVDELLNIIKNVSTYKNGGGDVIDNYRTWWYFIKILLHIPNNKIPLEIIQLIPLWLKSRFGSSLVDADLATKLLPKFLNKDASPEDLKKGELIIDYLTGIKWVNTKGMFKDIEEEPIGVADNHWLEEAFFNKGIAKLIGEIGSEDIIYKLASKLKTIFRKHHKTNWIDFDENNKTYRFSIDHEDDYRFVCKISSYEKKEKEGEGALLESLKVNPKVLFEIEINAQDINEFAQKIEASIKTMEVSDELKNEINTKSKDLYKNVLEDYSYIWLKGLGLQSSLHEIQHILLAILAVALDKKADENISSTKAIITKFLSNEYQNPAFTRLVLFTISNHWNTFKDIFWDKLFNRTDVPILEIPDFEPELRVLFKENVSLFSEEEKQKVVNMVDMGPQKYLPKDNPDTYVIYWKQRWYASLKENPFFNTKYEQIKALASFDDTAEDDTEGKWLGIPKSDFSSDEMIKATNTQIATFLLGFNKKDKLEERNSEALAIALEEAVKSKPEKFATDLEPFINTGFYYIHYILNGFKKAWSDKNSFSWDHVFSFIKRYIDRPEFWKNKLIVPSGFYNADNTWITGVIGELVQEGTRNDEWSIPEGSFHLVKEVFSLIANNAAKDKKDSDNYPNHVINCGLGKTLIGLVYFILRVARFEKKENEPRWSNDLKEIYEVFLNRNIYDAYTVLGEYLISFAYLDKEWTKKQITQIKESKDEVLWDAFMSGYLAGSRVNLDLYKLMKDSYLKSLSHNFKENQLNQRVIDHIGIAYLNGIEELEGDGLLGILWKNQNRTQIIEFNFYLWTQRENLKDTKLDLQMKSKIIDFWRQIYEKYKDKKNLTKNDKEILSEVVKLIVYLAEINDENLQWLLISVPYVEEHYNSAYLLEYLNILKDKGNKKATAQKIAGIFLKTLEFSKPYYDEGDIRSIVEFLYQVNDPEIKQLANNICDKYAKAGIEIVTEIYKKYNP